MTDYYDALDSEDFAEGPLLSLDEEDFDGFDPEDFDGEDFDGFDDFDSESDAFFGKIFKKIGRGLRKFKFLRKLAPMAGRIAGGFFGGPIGAKIGGSIGGMLREDEGFDGYDGEEFDFEEFDGEDEAEAEEMREDEAEAFGLDGFADGLVEEMAGLAAQSESESESAALLGGVTIHILSPAPITVKRLTPVMLRGTNQLGRYLRRRRSTRMLVRTIPTIQRRAVKMLTKRAQRGGKVTPLTVRKAMASATYKTLRSPRSAAKGLANNTVKRARLKRINKKAIARAER